MVPGFRYHIATIAGIFLALGVGIIIGSSFVQSAIVDSLNKRLSGLRGQFDSEVVALRDENRRYADFAGALTPLLISSRLEGKRVALVQTGDYPDAVRKAREALEQAGATVTNTTVVKPSFAQLAEVHISTLLPKLRATHPTLAEDAKSIMKVLAVLVTHGGAQSDADVLQDSKLIQADGDYSKPNDIVVLVGGASEKLVSRVDTIDIPLIALIKEQNTQVVEGEPLNADISYITELTDTAVSTVDNIDTDIGRLALVLSLRAGHGNYGVKKSAQSGILPQALIAPNNGNRSNPSIQ